MHYQRIQTQWPHDLLRPSVSFQSALTRRIDTRLEPSRSPPATDPGENVVANGALATIPPKKEASWDEGGELEQVNVLYSFLEDRYMKRVCMSYMAD